MSTGLRIILTQEDSRWVATHEATGVSSHGATRAEALSMLDEAMALHRDEAGEPVTDDDLESWGIEPGSAPDGPQVPDAPWFDSPT